MKLRPNPFFSFFFRFSLYFKMSAETNTEDIASDSKFKRKKTSWIWQHFKEDEIEESGTKISIIRCQEKNDNDEPCNKIYKNTGSSTGNAIHHLNSIHNLFQDETKKIENFNKVGLNILLKLFN